MIAGTDTIRNRLASKLSALMLFLSRTDRGAQARRGDPVSLRTLAEKVVEFHQFSLEEAGLHGASSSDQGAWRPTYSISAFSFEGCSCLLG